MATTTNIVRIQCSNSPCHQYEAYSSSPLTQQDIQEVQHFLEELDQNIIYYHPYLYANAPLNADKFSIILSKGCTTQLTLTPAAELPLSKVLDRICHKLLTSLHFLNCLHINACFNPFEEKDGSIPGLSLEPVVTDEMLGLAILPVNLMLEPAHEMGNAKMLLHYSKGNFYERREIVRLDKANGQVHFLNGEVLSQSSLKKAKLRNVTGFPLAERLGNYLQRIKENNQEFLENWGIQFDSRFVSRSSHMVAPGSITYRDLTKPLNDFIFPMARNTYNHYYRAVYKDALFKEVLTAEIFVFVPESMGRPGKGLVREVERVVEEMQLNVAVFRVDVDSYEKKSEVVKLLESYCRKQGPIYTFVVPVEPTKAEQDCLDFIKQELITRRHHFHFMELDPVEQADEVDVVALRNLAMLYPKQRLHPWILTQIPFGDKPTMACSLNVQEALDGTFSVALVFTMNKFFSRFISVRASCQEQGIDKQVFALLKNALVTFQQKFKKIPYRIFLYRTGKCASWPEEHSHLKMELRQFNVQAKNLNPCTLTYITLNKSHPFRTYTQTDDHYVNYHTVKKTQLLSTMEIYNKIYVQLEFDEPPMEVDVIERENDPTFMPKVVELTVKLCYGSAGNSFGKGLGFLEYAAKLNCYRNFDLRNWDPLMMDGFMFFL